jgi:hypothetical protein
MHGDGGPDCHLVHGQVQFVGAGQGIVARESLGEGRDWLVEQVEDRALNRPRGGCGRASISSQEVPGKRMRRSLTDSPCSGEFLAGERWCVIAWTGIGFNSPLGHASTDLAP